MEVSDSCIMLMDETGDVRRSWPRCSDHPPVRTDLLTQDQWLKLIHRLREEEVIFEEHVPGGGDVLSAFLTDAGALVAIGRETSSNAAGLLEVLEELEDSRLPFWRSLARRTLAAAPRQHDEVARLHSELKMTESTLRERNERLQALDRQKNYFISIAAHELRNPLSSIRFYADCLLEMEGLSEEKRVRCLESIRSSSTFMAHLVEDLLTVARLELGEMELHVEKTDLCALASETLGIYEALAEQKGIRILFEAEERSLDARVDRLKIEQVLNNLLSNAIKFSEAGSEVMLRLGTLGQRVHIAVEDEGRGIAPEEMEELFKPFSKVRRRGTAGESSTGLGLAITKSIVEGHGGSMRVESSPGTGSTFHVLLPVRAERHREGGLELENPLRSASV